MGESTKRCLCVLWNINLLASIISDVTCNTNPPSIYLTTMPMIHKDNGSWSWKYSTSAGWRGGAELLNIFTTVAPLTRVCRPRLPWMTRVNLSGLKPCCSTAIWALRHERQTRRRKRESESVPRFDFRQWLNKHLHMPSLTCLQPTECKWGCLFVPIRRAAWMHVHSKTIMFWSEHIRLNWLSGCESVA